MRDEDPDTSRLPSPAPVPSRKMGVRLSPNRVAYCQGPGVDLCARIRPRRNGFVLLVWPVLILAGIAVTIVQIMTLRDLVGLWLGGGEDLWTIRFVLVTLGTAVSGIVVLSASVAWLCEGLAQEDVVVRDRCLEVRRVLAGMPWRAGKWGASDVLGIEVAGSVNMLFDGGPRGPLPHSGLGGSIVVLGRSGRFRFGAYLAYREASVLVERIRDSLAE